VNVPVIETVLVDLTTPNGSTGVAVVEKTAEPLPVKLDTNPPEETVPDRLYRIKSPLLIVLNVVVAMGLVEGATAAGVSAPPPQLASPDRSIADANKVVV